MSWDAYLAYKESKSSKCKRRKLFPDNDSEIANESSDNENISPQTRTSSIRVIRADQIKSTPEILYNSFKKKKLQSNIISSFDSASDDDKSNVFEKRTNFDYARTAKVDKNKTNLVTL